MSYSFSFHFPFVRVEHLWCGCCVRTRVMRLQLAAVPVAVMLEFA